MCSVIVWCSGVTDFVCEHPAAANTTEIRILALIFVSSPYPRAALLLCYYVSSRRRPEYFAFDAHQTRPVAIRCESQVSFSVRRVGQVYAWAVVQARHSNSMHSVQS